MALFLINFKLYSEVLGERGKKIAESAKTVSERLGVNIVISPNFADIRLLSGIVPVVAQHIDPVESGAKTGHVTAESVKEAGAIGTMINHSEKRLGFEDIEKCVSLARRCGLITICCADSPENAGKIAKYKPDYILIEPPELIGGDRSVSKTNPQIIIDTVNTVRSVNDSVGIICGAGVSTTEDARIAKQLGAIGVGVASAIVKSKTPARVIENIAGGL